MVVTIGAHGSCCTRHRTPMFLPLSILRGVHADCAFHLPQRGQDRRPFAPHGYNSHRARASDDSVSTSGDAGMVQIAVQTWLHGWD
ncbi:hypothetical protein BD779DRAFT_1583361 [Infundibulicybe gibba]|nr:hypothetical protein BD779DRAFT_1583361 [Infundibulicybe gibba]